MRKPAMAVVFALLASGCIFGGGAQTRTVSVDYTSDEFPSAFLTYFPSHVSVHPGDTVLFKQAWSGEAHSVTMGTLANQLDEVARPYYKVFEEKGYAGLPDPPPPNVRVIDDQVRYMFTGQGSDSGVAQNGAQPCYLDQGLPPKDPNKPCTKAQQVQPDFTGRQNWYNSGYIHYAGPAGNTFRVRIAPNATPGSYFFFCNNHGPFMHGYLDIKAKSEKIPSQADANKTAQSEIDKLGQPVRTAYRDAIANRYPVPSDQVSAVRDAGLATAQLGRKTVFHGRFAGLGPEEGTKNPDAAYIVGFVPNKVQAKVGEKVTWVVLGGHTISFNVPKYFPIFTIDKTGTIARNPGLDTPAGGSPKLPASSGNSGGHGGPPSKPLTIDAGTWNGQGFYSSGLMSPDTFGVYSLRFSTPGTYKFACLVHPLMVGTLEVSA